MRNISSFVILTAALLAVACNQSPSGPSPIPTPNPTSPPEDPIPPTPPPSPMTPCEILPEACEEGREPFNGTTVFVPIPYTSEFLEWQIIATKPGMDGTYTRNDRPLISARCVDKSKLVKNLYIEGDALVDHGYGSGSMGRILSLTKFTNPGQITVCSRGWFEPIAVIGSNGGNDPLLACCSKIRDIRFKFWINRSSAPTLTPVDLEYDQYVGWTRVD